VTSCSHCGLSHERDEATCPITGESYAVEGLCGTTIDRYYVEKWLGGGGFGAVYRARHTVMDRPVALKVLHARMRTQPVAVRRFFGEAKAATAIGHPGIIQVFDAGTTPEGHAFLAMELVDGCSLKELAEAGPIRPTRALRIVIAVLDALAAAHHAGIIHRDVKPGNIMLAGTDPDGSRRQDRVRLVDFGVSKARQTRDPDDITRSGMAMGSPGYAAPEQYVSAKTADARSDIYGASVVLYQLLAGTLPFDAESYEQMVVKVCSTDPRPLARITPQVPPKLTEIVDRGVARNPDDRWATAEDMIAALRPWAQKLEGATAPTQMAPSSPPPAMQSVAGDGKTPTFIEAEPESPKETAAEAPSEATTIPRGPPSETPPGRSSSEAPPSQPPSEAPPERPLSEAPVAKPRSRMGWALFAVGALVALLVVGLGVAKIVLDGDEAPTPTPIGTAPVATETEPTVPVPVTDPAEETSTEATTSAELDPAEEETVGDDSTEVSDTEPVTMRRRRGRRARMRGRAMTTEMESMSGMREFGFEDIEPFDPE
jgi:serine/threonine-protein kinase